MLQRLVERQATAKKDLGDKLSRFGPRHPDVIQAQQAVAELDESIRAEVKRAVSVIESDAAAAQHTEQDLKSGLTLSQRRMIESKGNEAELRTLQANAEAARDRLTDLIRSRNQALALRDLRPVGASVIARSPSRQPSSPKPTIVLALALVGGLGTGISAAVLLEQADNGLRSSSEVKSWLGVRCVGMVPELRSLTPVTGGKSPRSIAGPERDFDEAIRWLALFSTFTTRCKNAGSSWSPLLCRTRENLSCAARSHIRWRKAGSGCCWWTDRRGVRGLLRPGPSADRQQNWRRQA